MSHPPPVMTSQTFGCICRREHAAGRSATQRPDGAAVCHARRPGDILGAALGQGQGRRQVCGCATAQHWSAAVRGLVPRPPQ